MAPKSAAHTFFATPELAQAVFAFLPRGDLPQCFRVCREWYQNAELLLWTHFCPRLDDGYKFPQRASDALIRNLPRIRSVDLEWHANGILSQLTYRLEPGISTRVASKLCTNLRRLKLQGSRSLRITPIVKLLPHNLQLTHLTLPSLVLTKGVTTFAFAAISNLRSLRHLTLEEWTPIGSPTILLLLQACLPLPELTELFLDFDFFDFDMIWQLDDNDSDDTSDLESMIQAAATARFSEHPTASKIKSLRLPTCRQGGRNPLPLPLLKSGLLDDLESCTIPWFSEEDTSPLEVEQIVREHCARLRQVECSTPQNWQDSRFIHAFLQGCSGLQSFVSNFFSDQRPLIDVEDMPSSVEPLSIVSTLISRHHTTLENLELTVCGWISSKDQQAVLSQCKELRRYWVPYSYRMGPPGMDFTDVSRSDWVCMGLRELSLRVNRDLNGEDPLSPDQLQAAKRVYTQIGRLHQLEVLVLEVKGVGNGLQRGDDLKRGSMVKYRYGVQSV
ncbi:hypothetical protein BGZ67_005277 [Mortierella alpina]|nr:hypothetical protein BGZ67_005277 [Mortierella alpina]